MAPEPTPPASPGDVCSLVDGSPANLPEAFFATGDDQIKARLRLRDDGQIEIVIYAPRTPLVDRALAGIPPELIRYELCG